MVVRNMMDHSHRGDGPVTSKCHSHQPLHLSVTAMATKRYDFIRWISDVKAVHVYVNDPKRGPSLWKKEERRKFSPTPGDRITTESFLPLSTPTARRRFFYQEPENVPIRVTATGAFHLETSASGHYHVQQYHPKTTKVGTSALMVRDTEDRMVWRAWNFEPDAAEGLNRYIRTWHPYRDLHPLIAKHLPAHFIPEHIPHLRQPSSLAFLLTEKCHDDTNAVRIRTR